MFRVVCKETHVLNDDDDLYTIAWIYIYSVGIIVLVIVLAIVATQLIVFLAYL